MLLPGMLPTSHTYDQLQGKDVPAIECLHLYALLLLFLHNTASIHILSVEPEMAGAVFPQLQVAARSQQYFVPGTGGSGLGVGHDPVHGAASADFQIHCLLRRNIEQSRNGGTKGAHSDVVFHARHGVFWPIPRHHAHPMVLPRRRNTYYAESLVHRKHGRYTDSVCHCPSMAELDHHPLRFHLARRLFFSNEHVSHKNIRNDMYQSGRKRRRRRRADSLSYIRGFWNCVVVHRGLVAHGTNRCPHRNNLFHGRPANAPMASYLCVQTKIRYRWRTMAALPSNHHFFSHHGTDTYVGNISTKGIIGRCDPDWMLYVPHVHVWVVDRRTISSSVQGHGYASDKPTGRRTRLVQRKPTRRIPSMARGLPQGVVRPNVPARQQGEPPDRRTSRCNTEGKEGGRGGPNVKFHAFHGTKAEAETEGGHLR
mmetsp:Transcript_7890/g.23230  ORF Transcript_7890/g.23230 Transcript_7890/m.23230 type:complete len:425 (+) Transcript_7890:1054-2328(+)